MAAVIAVSDNTPRSSLSAANVSAVSWAAILAGAAAAAALSLILVVLGTGLGLAALSPWTGVGASATAISWSTIAWIVFTALAASGLGGYIAGRLRMKWPELVSDEAFFRDTVHGFLSWAIATLLTAAVLASAIGTIAGIGAAGAGAAATGAVAAGAAGSGAVASGVMAPRVPASTGDTGPALGMEGSGQVNQQPYYAVDSLFRPGAPGYAGNPAAATPPAPAVDPGTSRDTRNEVARIFANNMHSAQLSQEDTTYVGQLVAQRTGMSQQDAEARVNRVYGAAYKAAQDAEAKARELAEKARKNAAYASLWVFISLLGGAFFASLMATVGGRRRDLY